MNIYLDTIGCRLNQSEIEKMAQQFRASGHTVVDNPAAADMVVINTCAVTVEAASDSRQKIRQAARAGGAQVVATGCWATMEPSAAAELPGVVLVVDNEAKDGLVSRVLNIPEETFDREPLAREPLPGLRARTRAFIKVQDGCNHFCTYCITRVLRGASRSTPLSIVLDDIRAALDGGAQEVVLTGVQLGSWGQDFPGTQRLRDLIEAILTGTTAGRIRLSSLEPWDLDPSFFDLWQDERMCPHLHLPLQSGSASVLKHMARKNTPEDYLRLVQWARAVRPDFAITSDFIVGFPGESAAEFEETLSFCARVGFAGGHVFPYSGRPGTPAARFKEQVAHPERKRRGTRLRDLLRGSTLDYAAGFVGKNVQVLWEAAGSLSQAGWQLQGYSQNYLRVRADHSSLLHNVISTVRISDVLEDRQGMYCSGQILD